MHRHFNTWNTFLTLGKPHKPKHRLSTLSSKHDPMCQGKYVWGKNYNSEPKIPLTMNSEFLESSKLSLWPFYLFHMY